MKGYPFKSTMLQLIALGVIVTVIAGWNRPYIADRWVGDVYLSGDNITPRKLDATMTIDMFASGYIVDSRGGVGGAGGAGYSLRFDGAEKRELLKAGYTERFLTDDDGYFNYSDGVCMAETYAYESTKRAGSITFPKLKVHLVSELGGLYETSKYAKKESCYNVALGIKFTGDKALFLSETNSGIYVVGDLRRESRLDPITRLVVWIRRNT